MRIFIGTSKTGEIQHYINTYSICSVARPRLCCFTRLAYCITTFQSTRSQDRDQAERYERLREEAFQSTRSQDRDNRLSNLCPSCYISIHSVARPRPRVQNVIDELENFNPLGRKTETPQKWLIFSFLIFQSTRSQDRDYYRRSQFRTYLVISIHSVARPRQEPYEIASTEWYFNPLGRKTETMVSMMSSSESIFQSTRSQDRDPLPQ